MRGYARSGVGGQGGEQVHHVLTGSFDVVDEVAVTAAELENGGVLRKIFLQVGAQDAP